MKFNKVKLKDITIRITKGTTPNKEAFNSNEVTYIKSDSLNYNGFTDENVFVKIDKNTHKGKLKRSILSENDILYSIAGAYLGKVGIVKKSYLPANTNQAVGIITVKDNIAIPKYIFYYLQQNKIKYFANNSISQSAQPNINLEQLGNFDIELCKIENQEKIVDILDSISEKIELNNKINDNLQKAVNLVYTKMFANKETSNFEQLKNHAECVLGGTPSRNKKEYWNGDINWINSGEVNKFRILTPSEKITRLGLTKSSTTLLPKYTTVLAITGATLGQVSRLEIDSCANQSVVGIIANKDLSNNYIYLTILNNIDDITKNQTGGAQQHINKGNVEEFKLHIPTKNELNEFENKVNPMFEKISLNCKENIFLENIRDTLLPKLMNGEIDLDKIEI